MTATADEMQAAGDLVIATTASSHERTAIATDAKPLDIVPEAAPPQPAATQPAAAIPVQLTLPPDSDLVMVETREVATSVAAVEEPEMPRTRRVRPARTVVADEPLQMVETRKEQAAP